jgi:hypothetical protein
VSLPEGPLLDPESLPRSSVVRYERCDSRAEPCLGRSDFVSAWTRRLCPTARNELPVQEELSLELPLILRSCART